MFSVFIDRYVQKVKILGLSVGSICFDIHVMYVHSSNPALFTRESWRDRVEREREKEKAQTGRQGK